MATNTDLYLQAFPLSLTEYKERKGDKIVKLTPVTSSGSPSDGSGHNTSQDVALALAAMTENLLKSMEKMIQFLSKEAEENAQTTKMNVAQAGAQVEQAQKAQKAYEASQSFWHKFGGIMLKYVLGPVLATLVLAATIWFSGPAAFALAAAILIVTMIPVHNGQGMLSSGVDAAVGAIGKDCGWSQATIDLVQGIVNIVVGIAVGIATGFAASAATAAMITDTVADVTATAAETATEATSSALETAVTPALDNMGIIADDTVSAGQNVSKTAAEKAASYATNVGKTTGISSAVSTLASSNCFNDFFYGIFAKSGMSDEKSKEIAAIMGIVMNILVMIASFGAGYTSMASLATDASELNPVFKVAGKLFGQDSAIMKLLGNSSAIGKALGGVTATQVQTVLRNAEMATAALAAGAHIVDGFQQKEAADLLAKITQINGALQFSKGTGAVLDQMTKQTNGSLKDALTKFDALEKAPNYSAALFNEAQRMQAQANQHV